MNVFIIGITGGVGGLLAQKLRPRDHVDEVEYYFAVKKEADVILSRSDLDRLILRPSLLLDGAGAGTVSLGPGQRPSVI